MAADLSWCPPPPRPQKPWLPYWGTDWKSVTGQSTDESRKLACADPYCNLAVHSNCFVSEGFCCYVCELNYFGEGWGKRHGRNCQKVQALPGWPQAKPSHTPWDENEDGQAWSSEPKETVWGKKATNAVEQSWSGNFQDWSTEVQQRPWKLEKTWTANKPTDVAQADELPPVSSPDESILLDVVQSALPGEGSELVQRVTRSLKEAHVTAAENIRLDFYETRERRNLGFIMSWIQDGLKSCWQNDEVRQRLPYDAAVQLFQRLCVREELLRPALGSGADELRPPRESLCQAVRAAAVASGISTAGHADSGQAATAGRQLPRPRSRSGATRRRSHPRPQSRSRSNASSQCEFRGPCDLFYDAMAFVDVDVEEYARGLPDAEGQPDSFD